MKRCYLGIDIGGTKCAVCLGNGEGEILEKISFLTEQPKGPQQTIDNFFQFTDQLLSKHNVELIATGVACGSPQDSERGIIQSPSQLPTWIDVPITDLFEQRYKVPAYLENDANASACAEFSFGAGRGCQHMVFMTCGTGLGAGIIINGQIYRGASGLAGEVGHMRLTPEGPLGCRKYGSYEGYCSGAGIAQVAAIEYKKFSGSTVLSPTPTTRDVGEAAEAGDELAQHVLGIAGHYLGYGLAYVMDILNPERVIIGSIFNRCEKFLRPPMEKALQEEVFPGVLEACEILPSGLGDDIGDYGAVSVAYQRHPSDQTTPVNKPQSVSRLAATVN